MKLIPLTKGAFAVVDDEDYDKVSQHKWHFHSEGYAQRGGRIYMHHMIVGRPPVGFEVDHINEDKLDNTRVNLRFVTKSTNGQRRPTTTKNGWRGVNKVTNRPGYFPRIRNKGEVIYLGYFHSPEEAARAYDKAALELHGPHAKLNFPAAGNQGRMNYEPEENSGQG